MAPPLASAGFLAQIQIDSMAQAQGRTHTMPLKNTVMLVNTFVVNTTQFLNHFSALAEEKLASVSRDVSRLEKVLLLLETKLYRPDAQTGQGEATADAPPALPSTVDVPSAAATPSTAESAPPSGAGSTVEALPVVPSPPAPPAEAEPDPRFAEYIRMKKFGIPRGAIEQKMMQNGVDPTGFPWDA